MKMRQPLVFAIVVSVAVAFAACSTETDEPAGPRVIRGASIEQGKQLIVRYGCGTCHEIPGIDGAKGLVAAPLTHFGRRGTIAGRLANTPDNLIRWVQSPQDVEPGTDMPNLGISAEDARNIAAYLESLQ